MKKSENSLCNLLVVLINSRAGWLQLNSSGLSIQRMISKSKWQDYRNNWAFINFTGALWNLYWSGNAALRMIKITKQKWEGAFNSFPSSRASKNSSGWRKNFRTLLIRYQMNPQIRFLWNMILKGWTLWDQLYLEQAELPMLMEHSFTKCYSTMTIQVDLPSACSKQLDMENSGSTLISTPVEKFAYPY